MSYLFDGATPWLDDDPPKGQPADARLRSVKRRSGIAVSVYIVGSPGGMRHATKADVAAARALGLGVLPNWERAADFFRTATLADCKQAGVEALAACRALGFPDDGSGGVPFSFDYQVPASGYKRALDQLRACGDGMGGHYQPLGYAQIDLINYWAAHGLPGPHWLMGSTWRASSTFTRAEVASPAVALVQSHTAAGAWLNSRVAATDINTITQPTRLPAWWPDGSPYAGGFRMDADVTAAFNKINGEIAALTQLVRSYFTVHSGRTHGLSAQLMHELRGIPFTGDPQEQSTPAQNIGATATAAARALADLTPRMAELQAQVAALAAKVDAQPTVQPSDIPVTITGTGTAHIGGSK